MSLINTKLRNYSTKVPADRTIAAIEKQLTKVGVRRIEKFFAEGGNCEGLMFQMEATPGQLVTLKLPARTEAIYKRFRAGVRGEISPIRQRGLREQAHRTAWRTLAELVQIHLDMMDLGQSTLLESFLSQTYNQATGATLYEAVVASELKLLN